MQPFYRFHALELPDGMHARRFEFIELDVRRAYPSIEPAFVLLRARILNEQVRDFVAPCHRSQSLLCTRAAVLEEAS